MTLRIEDAGKSGRISRNSEKSGKISNFTTFAPLFGPGAGNFTIFNVKFTTGFSDFLTK